MNKNKLSRFLLSTSVGILTLGISEVSAASETAALQAVVNSQAADAANHKNAAIVHFKGVGASDAKAAEYADKLIQHPQGLSALNNLGGQTADLFGHFKQFLEGGVDLTGAHFDSFLSQIADSATLRELGVESVRELQSPAAERRVAPEQITSLEDAIYFAEQRKDSGEFEKAAGFYLKAQDLTEVTNTTKRVEYAEAALLMYSEHFIHHVARVSSVTEANVTAAQTLLTSVKTLAESTNTAKGFLRAASCAEELGTAIFDLATTQKAARDKLTDADAIAAENKKIALTFVSLYNADIVARDMHEKAAAKYSGQEKNARLAVAADAMRLAIGALADAHAASATAVFSGDVKVSDKLYDETVAFKGLYLDLANTSGVTAADGLKTSAASAKILVAKLNATWKARIAFGVDTDNRTALNTQYTDISTLIKEELAAANARYQGVSAGEHYWSARDIATVRSIEAERLYRLVLDAAAVDPLVEEDVNTAVTALKDYVAGSTDSVKSVVNDMDTALKATLDEVKAADIRSASTDSNRILARSYGLIAKATAKQLAINDPTTAADKTAEWLESYLTYARLSNSKDAWEAGVTAADKVMTNTTVLAAANDENKLIKALALTAKAEALLKRNTVASDDLVATVDVNNALAAGILFDAKALATGMADGALHVTAHDNLRKAFETAVELHNSNAVKQGLRTAWAAVEDAYAIGKLALTDTHLTTNINIQLGNGDFVAEILSQLGPNADRDEVVEDLSAWIDGAGSAGAAAAGTLAKHYDLMRTTPAVAVDGVKLEDLDTVEDLYNHLMKKFASIRKASGIYQGYEAAATAFDKARTAQADWAAAEVAGLSSTPAATWATKRDNAGVAYTAAVDYEFKRLRALFAAAGHGIYDTTDAAFATIAEITTELEADGGLLAAAYVNEDVLKSLHRRAVNLKDAAATYERTRAAVGSDALIDANEDDRDAAIGAAVHNATGGAYETAVKLVRAAYQGLSGYNAGASGLIAQQLQALTDAYSKVNAAWLEDLTNTLKLAATTDAAAHKAALHGLLLVDAAIISSGANSALMVGRVNAITAKVVTKQSAHRDIAHAYETVLRTVVSLGTAELRLEELQTHLYTALKVSAKVASTLPLTAYTPGAVTKLQLDNVILQLTERADLAEAVVSAAYGALRSNTPSDATKTYKVARAQAITAMTGLIQEGGMDLADVVLKEENVLATADLKARAAHQLGRLLMAKAAAERIRFDNLGVTADKDLAKKYYVDAIDAYKKEIAAVLSQSDASLMADRNTRLVAAYKNLSEAYKQAITNGADATLVKEQYMAVFNQAQIEYRENHRDRAAKMLEDLTNTAGAAVVHGTILRELAEQYEADGKFLKSAKAYKASTQNHVANKDAAPAYEAAENALKAANQAGHSEAYVAAAEAFNLIGATIEFHGRIRAEAYSKAAEAYFLGEMNEAAAVAYNASGAEWTRIGDHMQAGNQHEKAAWALSKVASVTVDQRIEVIQAVEKAAEQLQIADATDRITKLVSLAEAQIQAIEAVEDKILTGQLKAAVVAAAGALYQKALAFQKEGDLSHAEAAEARIEALMKKVDANKSEAAIHVQVAKLYSLQNKHALAVTTYIEAAENFAESKELLKAATAYADAADAALAAGVGARIKAEILPALLEISASVRSGGANAGVSDQFEIHLKVVEVYRDLAKLNPSEIDAALAEVVAIEAEAPTQKDMQARIAGVKIELLSQKSLTLKTEEQKVALLQQAQAAFDVVKGLTGETTDATVSVKKFVAIAANSLIKMYELTRVIHSANGSTHLDAFRVVLDTAEAAAVEAHKAAGTVKSSYDVALVASREAAKAFESYTKAMLHYIMAAKEKARAEDVTNLRGMSDRVAKVISFAVEQTLLGTLQSREAAKKIQENLRVAVNALNKVNTFIVSLRKNEASRDSYGNAAHATNLKAIMAATAATVKGAAGDLKEKAEAAQAKPTVARAAATDKLVAEKTAAIVSAVSTGVTAQAALVKQAPAAEVSHEELANHAEEMLTTVKGLVGDLQKAQSGPSTTAAAVAPSSVRG